ncbi:DNA replication/repair protein RecF, partial [Patescibacteria group bacterium]
MIQNVRLQQFRSYQDASYEFEPGVNIVVGPNASGKTNLIESLLVAGQGHSYRVNDRDLIQHNKDWARVDVLYDGVPRAVKLRQDGRLEKRFVIAGEQRVRMAHNQVIPMVLFEPNHLQLFTQSPDLRRSYLDSVLAYTDPTYDTLAQTYRRALAQRNKLLTQPHTAPDMYFVWNVRLSEIGGQIAQRRAAFVREHQEAIQAHYNRLVDVTHDVGVVYSSRLPLDNYNEHMLRELERVVETDRLRGFTSLGPHRD